MDMLPMQAKEAVATWAWHVLPRPQPPHPTEPQDTIHTTAPPAPSMNTAASTRATSPKERRSTALPTTHLLPPLINPSTGLRTRHTINTGPSPPPDIPVATLLPLTPTAHTAALPPTEHPSSRILLSTVSPKVVLSSGTDTLAMLVVDHVPATEIITKDVPTTWA